MAPKIRREDKALQGPWHQTFNLAIKEVPPLIPNNYNTTRQKEVNPAFYLALRVWGLLLPFSILSY